MSRPDERLERGKLFELGPIAVAYWSPRLGEAPGETYVRRPRRLTAAIATRWWSPSAWRFSRSPVRTNRLTSTEGGL